MVMLTWHLSRCMAINKINLACPNWNANAVTLCPVALCPVLRCVSLFYGRKQLSTSTRMTFTPLSPLPTDTVIHVANPADRSVQRVTQQPVITSGPPGHAPAQPVLHPARLAAKQCTKVEPIVYKSSIIYVLIVICLVKCRIFCYTFTLD